jgi:signal transduction histidine kinase
VQQGDRSRSIQWKLPLLISALLTAVIATYTVMIYGALRHATVSAAEMHVQSVANRLASMTGESARRIRADLRGIATDPAIRQYLRTRDRASREAAERVLQGAGTGSSALIGVELRDTSGARLITLGSAPDPLATMPARAALREHRASDVWLSPLVAVGDTMAYRVTASIVGEMRDTLGHLVQYRRLSAAPAGQTLRDLIDTSTIFLVGNATGDFWTDLARATPGPSTAAVRTGLLTRDAPDTGRQLGAAAEVAATPWVVWVGVPEPVILAPVHTMVRRLLLMALGILLLGAGIAWIASTRIVMPLRQLTRAAEGIAAGDYTVRVPTERTDELGRLATSFNSMAAQVDDGRRTLEARVEERTAELSDALERLHSAQEELVRKEKLALLGQLAGGVGHELRNPLGVMTNAVHYLGLVLPDAPPTVHEYLGILRTQIGLAERIVGDLLDSARVKSPEREPVAIGPLLTEQLGRVGRPDDVRVAFDIAPDVPHAYVDRVQIGQVLVNLITNGVQAMAGRGGTLTLRANRDGGRQVRVDVIDTGPGIADEHLAKIFEPLFTTKARGIGLGLAVARTLALANGGTLTVASQPGMGATFRLLLPTVAAEGA